MNVSVAGKLTVNCGGNIYVDSNNVSLVIGTLSTPSQNAVTFTTFNNANVVLATSNTLNDAVVIETAGTLQLDAGVTWTTSSMIAVANSIVTGPGSGFTTTGSNGLSLTTNTGPIGSPINPFNANVSGGGQLDAFFPQGNMDVATVGVVELGTVNAPVIAIDAGTLQATNNNAIAATSTVDVEPAGTLDVNSYSLTCSNIAEDGGQIINEGGHLVATNGFILYDGTIGNISGSTPIAKQGSGTATISGTNTAPLATTAGTVNIATGATLGGITALPAPGQTAQVEIAPSTPATAQEVGTVDISTGGTLGLALDPSVLMTTGLTLATGSTYTMTILGPNPGTGYDQTIVNGAVTISNSTLNLTVGNGYTPVTGTVFDIIQNTGGSAVTGQFNNLPQGAVMTVSGISFRISYQGGTSTQDVTLTVVTLTGPTISGTPASATNVSDNQTATPFGSSVSLADTTASTTYTLTVTLLSSTANGTLSNLGGGAYNSGTGVYSLTTTTIAAAQSALHSLVFTPTANQVAVGATVTTTFTIAVNDGTVTATDSAKTMQATGCRQPDGDRRHYAHDQHHGRPDGDTV